jgi:surfactin synthase thioesterase subunit
LKARETVRLFSFHHAGGGGAMFNAWNKALGPGVDVVPVEILNRERFTTLRQLVGEVGEQLGSALDSPHVFFGHSFGALLAYRLACLRAASGSSRAARTDCVLLCATASSGTDTRGGPP